MGSVSNRHIGLRYCNVGEFILFSCLDGLVRDQDGATWKKVVYRNSVYFRKTGTSTRVSRKTLRASARECNVIL